MTLLELIVSSSLLALLTAALFFSWESGSRAWLVASQRQDLISAAQVVLRRVERVLEASSSAGLAYQNNPAILTLPSCFGVNATSSEFAASDTTGEVNWQKYTVVYQQGAQLFWLDLPIPTGNTARTVAAQLPAVDLGSGLHGLPFYATGGAKVADGVGNLTISLSGRAVILKLDMSASGRTASFSSTTLLRN